MSIHEPRSARAAQLELPSVWRASSASILSNRGKQCKRCKQRNHCGQASSASSANKASSISTGGKQCKQGGSCVTASKCSAHASVQCARHSVGTRWCSKAWLHCSITVIASEPLSEGSKHICNKAHTQTKNTQLPALQPTALPTPEGPPKYGLVMLFGAGGAACWWFVALRLLLWLLRWLWAVKLVGGLWGLIWSSI
eukprot:1161288-Pelagomonas_calceolata.AAC.4